MVDIGHHVTLPPGGTNVGFEHFHAALAKMGHERHPDVAFRSENQRSFHAASRHEAGNLFVDFLAGTANRPIWIKPMASPVGRKPAVADFREVFELTVAPLALL